VGGPRKKMKNMADLKICFGALAVLALASSVSAAPSQPPQICATPAGIQLAQSNSTRCQTKGGVCRVPAQPVGAPCRCGDRSGQIIR